MNKEEKKRSFESEALILPALRMFLVENEKNESDRPGNNVSKKKNNKDFDQDTVMKLIGKLSLKD